MNGIFLIVFLVALLQCGYSDIPSKLLVTVYYESKCPDSRKFVNEQLVSAVNLLQDYLVLRLIPFGKANSLPNGYGFNCQHGPSECLGNLVQDCALYYMQDRTDAEKVAYVSCEMTTLAGTVNNMMCVQNSNIPVDLVHQCINSTGGLSLQMISEKATKRISPSFVPTITINDVFDKQIQSRSLVDLTGTLCTFLQNAPPCNYHLPSGNTFLWK